MDLLKILWVCFFVFCFWCSMSDGAGGDCMSSSTIDCFECNTWDDPRCHDPFNFTDRKEDMPPRRECEGCCVKMVQFVGTEHYQIRRTCTDDFDVNFFMVNHACMTEGHRHGHMCFCEEDECNGAATLAFQPMLIISALIVWSVLSKVFHSSDVLPTGSAKQKS